MKLKHASLFSGIGGPEVAAAMLGWDNVFHCEINPFGRAVLEYWFPNSKSYDDITKTDFREWRGRVDVLTGGFPCQPFSYAGKRGGRNDDRYLWPEMLRAIDEIRPAWVVGENVAGITTMVEGGVLADMGCDPVMFGESDGLHRYQLRERFTIERICCDLEGLGYAVQPLLIPAAAVGAPHRRDRVFIVAHDADADGGDDVRIAGIVPRERGTAGVQERDAVRESGVADKLRSEVQGTPADTDGYGRQEDNLRREAKQSGKNSENAIKPQSVLNSQSGIAPDPDGERREEPQLPGRGKNPAEDGRTLHDRTERPGRDGSAASTVGIAPNADGERFNEPVAAEIPSAAERFNRQTDFEGRDRSLCPESRWSRFPTVSPVHRGNDGLPFPLDDLTIPATKWRTESLKAYGNAIVPQVMYRIFEAIDSL